MVEFDHLKDWRVALLIGIKLRPPITFCPNMRERTRLILIHIPKLNIGLVRTDFGDMFKPLQIMIM